MFVPQLTNSTGRIGSIELDFNAFCSVNLQGKKNPGTDRQSVFSFLEQVKNATEMKIDSSQNLITGDCCYVASATVSSQALMLYTGVRCYEPDKKTIEWMILSKQPLADAVYYKNQYVIKLLEKHGAKPPIAPMHVQNSREVPEYEIDPSELDFSNSVNIIKVTYEPCFLMSCWNFRKAFRDELALLQKIRHPNVVQFLGAVTQSSPMIIVTEYLPKV
ncbi:serine/threonine-protein kinase STY8-like isoform X3 [Gossypium australe]|uniref:Serine/threonine-protein kinase STY8-like isoform X3 n=1 Tax=Gossypium australe TaxID=47621 RepID=A0A5B6VD50_9ROSI|nr:serine/threonine-protein kinase STY8-like isoform X3 [Gossypium australe]